MTIGTGVRAGCLAALVLSGCAVSRASQAPLPSAVGAASTSAELTVVAVPFNPDAREQRTVGRFAYVGGVELTPRDGGRFGGLSDLEVLEDGRLLSITDEGQLLQAQLIVDDARGTVDLRETTFSSLTDLDGQPLRDKARADAEGITVLPGGDLLVSFEREHRIWRYPGQGRPPVAAPAPLDAASFPLNNGMEAIVAFPAGGAGAYLVGSEGGTVWLCALDSVCRETALGARVPEGFGLTAIAATADGSTIALLTRAFDTQRGVRVILRLVGRDALDEAGAPMLDELSLVAPLTRDNFEGVSLGRGAGGALRIYLLSDNNFSATQHTYLLVFDWGHQP